MIAIKAIETNKLNSHLTAKTMVILLNQFNVNLNWLSSGNGLMFIESEDEISIKDIILRLQEYEKMIEGE